MVLAEAGALLRYPGNAGRSARLMRAKKLLGDLAGEAKDGLGDESADLRCADAGGLAAEALRRSDLWDSTPNRGAEPRLGVREGVSGPLAAPAYQQGGRLSGLPSADAPALSNAEAAIWALVNPFSPAGDGTRLSI